MRARLLTAAATAAVALATSTLAHTAWLEPVAGRTGVWVLRFGGHAGRLEPVMAANLREVAAMDANGRSLAVERSASGADTHLSVAGRPALIVLHYDNGVHTRTAAAGPSVRRPMNEVSGAVSATNALKYGKSIVQWTAVVTRPVGQPFEVIPLIAEPPRAGRPMPIQVRQDGRPVQGVRIGRGEDTAEGVTDSEGRAAFTPVAGPNRLWAGRRIEVRDEPRYTQLSYEYLMTFEAR